MITDQKVGGSIPSERTINQHLKGQDVTLSSFFHRGIVRVITLIIIAIALIALLASCGGSGTSDIANKQPKLVNGYPIYARANLNGADLNKANLRKADLRKARLREADLSYADLRKADLSGADLSGANMAGAKLEGALLAGVFWDASTIWPVGFTPPPSATTTTTTVYVPPPTTTTVYIPPTTTVDPNAQDRAAGAAWIADKEATPTLINIYEAVYYMHSDAADNDTESLRATCQDGNSGVRTWKAALGVSPWPDFNSMINSSLSHLANSFSACLRGEYGTMGNERSQGESDLHSALSILRSTQGRIGLAELAHLIEVVEVLPVW